MQTILWTLEQFDKHFYFSSEHGLPKTTHPSELNTTEDTWQSGTLLQCVLLLRGPVDNRGHMTKWYFTLLFTSLWPC